MENYVTPVLLAVAMIGVALLAWRLHRSSTDYDAELANLRARNADLDRQLAVERVHSNRVPDLEGQLTKVQGQKAELETSLARLSEALDQERKQSEEKLNLLREARDDMTKEFKVLAAAVMQENGQIFSKQNKEQIDVVLTPLREKLTEFQLGLTTAHSENVRERAALAEQIKQLSAASATMTSETSSLTRALKGKAQTQGAWGEMILATILEKSGLRQGEEYVTQTSHTTEDGQRLRPDVIVNLPGGQRIVIDAKVSLTAFEAYVNAGNDEDRAASLQRHLASMRTHIKTLGDKGYQVHTNGGVDYVIMFVPIEGALAIALQEAPDMTSEALAQNVNIATPTTLMIALRTAASVWQVERRSKNAETIATRAGQLYDKFVGFIEDMRRLGQRMEQAQSTYTDALSKLTNGNGNLLRQVEMIKNLGAKTSKMLPTDFLDAAEPAALPTPDTTPAA
jgi:DNA recombination protein RmuC